MIRLKPEDDFLAKLQEWRSPDGESWDSATPTFQIQAFQKGKLRIDLAFGNRYRYYDWASLTKIVFATTSAMSCVEDGRIHLSDRLTDWLPELTNSELGLGKIRLRDLLSHSAGMSWWRPFYKKIDLIPSRDHEIRWNHLIGLVVRDVKQRAKSGELETARIGTATYSDLDFFLLGEVLKRSTQLGFGTQWSQIAERLRLEDTYFHVSKHASQNRGVREIQSVKHLTAPTEIDKRRGAKPVQGEVHDENASSLMGLAPHSGLFGPIHDLSKYGLELRKLARGEKSRLPKSGAEFLKRSVPKKKGDWALGFMMPTIGRASCGPRFSPSSIGHTGFTGTSLWFDPKSDVLITILSNRVCPTRKNTRFLQLRPALHSMVMESLNY
jgi:CubicO group peptidase (beta-lactamase class C family)